MYTFVAFVDVMVAFRPSVSTWASTCIGTIDHARLADGSSIARVGRTSIVQVAKETRFVWRTFANVTGHAIMTSTSIQTGLLSAIIHIYFTIVAFVPIDTDTGVAAFGIVTSGAVLAHVRPQSTFVHILCTIPTCVFGRAVASVSTDAVHADTSILTKMSVAVVDIDVATGSGKA